MLKSNLTMITQELVREATVHPDLIRTASATSNEGKCLLLGVFGNTDDELSVPEIIETLEVLRGGPCNNGLDRAYWSAACKQAVQIGVLHRTHEGTGHGLDVHKYSLTDWGWTEVRPFAAFVVAASLDQNLGIRKLVGEPRVPRNGEATYLFGRLGLLEYTRNTPLTFAEAHARVREYGLFDDHPRQETVKQFTHHPLVKRIGDAAFRLADEGRPIHQAYFDLIQLFLEDNLGLTSIGNDLLDEMLDSPVNISTAEDHMAEASNNVGSSKIADYSKVGSKLYAFLSENIGSIHTSRLPEIFPSLTHRQLRIFKTNIYSGGVPGLSYEQTNQGRVIIITPDHNIG
jgi:hypothetical protein